MILVAGRGGNVGGEVVAALARAGVPVRGLSRGAGAPVPGVEWVTGDLNRPETLEGAIQGVDSAFLMPGYSNMPELLERVARAGVRRIVLMPAARPGSGT